MANGANFIHKQLRNELENYIKTQYFSKSPILLSALSDIIDKEGVLYQKPFIESSPAYVSVKNGLQNVDIADWLKKYFLAGLGVFPAPFTHQIKALDKAVARLIQGIPQKGLISGLFADGRPMRSYFFALPPVR